MKFFIQTIKTANKFHFLSNLTGWHFSCRENDNKRWLKKTGKLTREEKKALKLFTKILKKYDFGKNFIGKPFIRSNEKEVWKNIKKIVNKKEIKEIQEIFSIFDKRFEKIWKKEGKRLMIWKKILRKNLNKNKKIKEIFKKSRMFLKVKRIPKNIRIYLLVGSGGGGANVGKDAITLDCANRPLSYQKYLMGIVIHEILHVMARYSNYYRRSIKKIIKKFKVSRKHPFIVNKMGKHTIINEAIIESLCPEGYMSTRYLFGLSDKKANEYLEKRIHNAKNKFSEWRAFSAKELYLITKDYFENKKPIDKKFFEMVVQVFKKFNLLP